MKRVVVGMSGGVDSSVAAYLLKKQGYEVIGLFMRNWKETDDNDCCTAESDFVDVRRVSQVLDIPYFTVDFSKEYWDKVFTLFIEEYKAGRTPNPDVLCNKEIKFEAFRNHALKLEADYIATGHYCDILHQNDAHHLLMAVDQNKDQTYFLNQVTSHQLSNTLFPLGSLTKVQVREIATQLGFTTANKKDSTGVCFIGERNFRQFLSNYIPMTEGDILDLSGKKVGRHKGVYYYTIGQRRGLGIGGDSGGEYWYVIKKDVEKNILYVNNGLCDELFANEILCDEFNFISVRPVEPFECVCRIRHRGDLIQALCYPLNNGSVRIISKEPYKGVALGQYAVVYSDKFLTKSNGEKLTMCVGGGVITGKDYIK